MSTIITYKTLSLKQQLTRNIETFSKATTVYNPICFDEHLINLVRPNVLLSDIQCTITTESAIITETSDKPLYSFVWFLN